MEKVKIENIFLIFSLIFGFLLVFLIPPFNSPDEDSHFKKAYSVSRGHFYAKDNGTMIGNYFPSNLLVLTDINTSRAGNLESKTSYLEFVMNLQTLEYSSDETFYHYSTAQINPFMYFVPAFGILFSKVVNIFMGAPNSITSSVYFARMFCLIIYSLVVYYAIKKTPKFKRTIMAFCLLPMTLSLFSCVSYDGILISSTALLFSIICKYRYDNKQKYITNFDLTLLFIIAFIYLNVKSIYVFNFLLLLLIPIKKFDKDKKSFLKRYGIALFFLLLLHILSNIPNYMLKSYNLEYNKLVSQQIQFVLHHPFKYIFIYCKTLFTGRFFYLTTFVGVLGLLDTYIPFPIVFLNLLFLFITFIVDGNDTGVKIKVKERLLSLVVPIAIISLSFLGLYIYWTSYLGGYGVGAKTISGVQGRYFIPALMVMGVFFSNKFKGKVFNSIKLWYNNLYIGFYIMVLSITVLTVLLRFYI